jgi:hypothetical protein
MDGLPQWISQEETSGDTRDRERPKAFLARMDSVPAFGAGQTMPMPQF